MEEPVPSSQKLTDLKYLSEISKGDPEFMTEMIRIFLDENPREIDLLEKGIKEKNLDLIHMASHKLRSTLPFVGIEKIVGREVEEIESIAINYSAKQTLEIAADSQEGKIEIMTTDLSVMQKLEELFPRIKTVCERARQELRA